MTLYQVKWKQSQTAVHELGGDYKTVFVEMAFYKVAQNNATGTVPVSTKLWELLYHERAGGPAPGMPEEGSCI